GDWQSISREIRRYDAATRFARKLHRHRRHRRLSLFCVLARFGCAKFSDGAGSMNFYLNRAKVRTGIMHSGTKYPSNPSLRLVGPLIEGRMHEKTISIILAGGIGSRLHPLTAERAKPAVPFGGRYRIIDFTLSNCLHSGLRRILVLTQYKSHSLQKHLRDGWSIYNSELGDYITPVPP